MYELGQNPPPTQQPQQLYYNTFVTIMMSTSTSASEQWFNNSGSSSSSPSQPPPPQSSNSNRYGDRGKNIPLINQPLQALTLTLILISAILTNGAVILNISRDSLKLRMVHFLLIRHVCITDSVGAIMVLPIPLLSFIKGYWDWGETACAVISTTTACCWTMHLVAVALYRADRVFAVWLPTGRYPVISARVVNGLLVLVWSAALSGSYLATYAFTPAFQPALALCIPNVPLVFFILVFACYCLALITLTTGYVFAFLRRRRKRRRKKQAAAITEQQQEQPATMTTRSVPNLYFNKTSDPQENNKSSSSSSSPTYYSSSPTNPRPTTPPPRIKRDQLEAPPYYQTHRRVHSEPLTSSTNNNKGKPGVTPSNGSSVLSVEYKTLEPTQPSRSNHNSDEEEVTTHEAEETVAEKLDECDTGLSNSSNNNVAQQRPQQGSPASARCRVISSYAVSIGHLILYLPAMLVIGFFGPSLPPSIAFLCGLVVYCEFIVQPVALLLVSPKLRGEVITMITGYVRSASTRFRDHHSNNNGLTNNTTTIATTNNQTGEQTNDDNNMLNIVVVLDESTSRSTNSLKTTITTLPPPPDQQNS